MAVLSYGRRPEGRSIMALVVMVVVAAVMQTSAAHDIRRNNEPFMYKTAIGRYPMPFPKFSTSRGNLEKQKMTMLVGMCSEDRKVKLARLPRSPLETTTTTTPEQAKRNTIHDMKKVLKMEKDRTGEDPLMTTFQETMADNTTTSDDNNNTTSDNNSPGDSVKDFQDRVLDFLSLSGIDALLPLDCGRNPTASMDPLAIRGRFPWLAALGSHEDGRFHYRCTGVVISKNHILTDADCVTSSNINVVLLNATEVPNSNAIVNYVAGRRVHPEIRDSEDLLSGNNIGILELGIPLQFNDYVQPACLPGQFEDPDPEYTGESTLLFYTINDSPTGRQATLFRWVDSNTLGSSRCYSAIRRFRNQNPAEPTSLDSILTKKHICVDRSFEFVGKSAVFQVNERTGRVQVIGVGGVANAAKTNPIAYTHVQPHRFWIEVVLRKFRDNTIGRRRQTQL